MEKTFGLFYLLAVALQINAQPVIKGDSWASVKNSGSGTLGIIYYEQPGLISKMPDGQMKGVCVDIVSDFAAFVQKTYKKKLNIEYVYEESEFPRFLQFFQQSHYMLGVTNTSITDERKKTMKFTPSYMNSDMVLLTNKNAPALTDLSQISTVFKGFTAQVITGSTHARYVESIKKENFPDLRIEYVPSGEIIIKNLSTNPNLFSIIDFTEYIGVIRKQAPVKKHEVSFSKQESLGFIMSKQSDWDGVWREFLTPEYVKSVRYKEIIARNLGSSFLTLVR